MTSKQKVDTLKIVTVVGFTLAVLYHYVLVNYLGLNQYPFNTFLFAPADKFKDFFNIYNASVALNPYESALSVYFPFTFVIMYMFSFLGPKLAFFSFSLIFLVAFSIFIIKYTSFLSNSNKIFLVFILVFMSYPSLFLLDRGNVESLVFIFLALFIYYYQKGEDIKSIVWLSFAASMKLYPIVFVMLFIADKKYKQMLIALVLVFMVSLFSAFVLHGGVMNSYVGVKRNLALFSQSYFTSDTGLQHNSSLFGVFRILQSFFPGASLLVKSYNFLAVVFASLLSLNVLFGERILWKQVALLVFSILLLPQVSFDYKLIHLLIPIMLFVQAKSDRFDFIYVILFGLLIIPKDYYIITADISIAVIINPLLMIIIIGLFIIQSFNEKRQIEYQQQVGMA